MSAAAATPPEGPPGAPHEAFYQHEAFRAVKAHGTIWRANLNKAASGACLSSDGTFMAFCDGTSVLTISIAAAADAESSSPHKGALASPVGLLSVSDCPETPVPISYGGSLARGTGSKVTSVQHTVRQMLTATHFVPQHRRFHCVCWLPTFSLSEFTYPATEGPLGVSRRCMAGLRGGGCRCLAVSTREGSVSVWIQKDKETPLPQPLALACDLGLIWRKHCTQAPPLGESPGPPHIHIWHFLPPPEEGSTSGSLVSSKSSRVPLSNSGIPVSFDEPLVAAPTASLCFPCFQGGKLGSQGSEEQQAANMVSRGSSRISSFTEGLFSGTVVAVASQGFIAIFLVSGSHLRHCASGWTASSSDPDCSTDVPTAAKSDKPCPRKGSQAKQSEAPHSPPASSFVGKDQAGTIGPSERPRRAATRRARAALSAALSAEVSSDPEAAGYPPPRTTCRLTRGRGRGGGARQRKCQETVDSSPHKEGNTPVGSTEAQKQTVCEGDSKGDTVEAELTKTGRPGGKRSVRKAPDTPPLSPSSASFVASEAPSSSSSSIASFTDSSSLGEKHADSFEEETDDGSQHGRRQQATQGRKQNPRGAASAADATDDGGLKSQTSSHLCEEAERQQESWRRYADADAEAADFSRTFAASGLLNSLLLTVVTVPRFTSCKDGNSGRTGFGVDSDWASVYHPREGFITDIAVGRPRVRAAASTTSRIAGTGSHLEGNGSDNLSEEMASEGQRRAASLDPHAVCCSFEVIATLSNGAAWNYNCSFHLLPVHHQQQQHHLVSDECITQNGTAGITEFLVENITAAATNLLLTPSGFPSGFLQLSEVKAEPLLTPDASKLATETTAVTAVHTDEMRPPKKPHEMHQQQVCDLLAYQRVVATVSGSRLRVAVLQNYASCSTCFVSETNVSPQLWIYRAETSLFALGSQRGLEGPVVSLCILPALPLDLAAAAIRQVPVLENGSRPFHILLVALQKGAILPFALYPDYPSTLNSDSNRCYGDKSPSWILQPLAPLTSLNRSSRIENLLMPRATHAFKPMAPRSLVSDTARVAAVTAALAAQSSDAASADGSHAVGADCKGYDGSFPYNSVGAEGDHRQQQHSQHCSPIESSESEGGDPASRLCPPSVTARRSRALLSRRLMALTSSPCGSLLYFAIQQSETTLQLAVAPIDVSPATVALLSLEYQISAFLESVTVTIPSLHKRGFPENGRVDDDQLGSPLALGAAAARCCAESQSLWALRLALRGPLQRTANSRAGSKSATREEGGRSTGAGSRRRGNKDIEAQGWPSEDDELSVISDWGVDATPATGGAAATGPLTLGSLSCTAIPSRETSASADSPKDVPCHVYLRETFSTPSTERRGEPDNDIDKYDWEPIRLLEVLREAWGLASEAELGVSLQSTNMGALWFAILETLEADALLRFSCGGSTVARQAAAACTPASRVRWSTSSGGEGTLQPSADNRYSSLCSCIAAAYGQRRRLILRLALRLRRLLAIAGAYSLHRDVRSLIGQHLRAVVACLVAASPSVVSAGCIREPSTFPQCLSLLLLSNAPREDKEQGLGPTSGNNPSAAEAAATRSKGISLSWRSMTLKDAELHNLLLESPGLENFRGVAARKAVDEGEARLHCCPLCRGSGCTSPRPFRFYVCTTYGHRFPACAQCLRCLCTGSSGASGAPLPLAACSADCITGEAAASAQECEHDLGFFSCLLCDAFVCGGELPENSAMQGCGWWPYDSAVARSGRCCPLCRGAVSLASALRCCSRLS